jgi:hypothetical protein
VSAEFDLLLPHAQRVAQFPRDRNAYSNLVVRLQLVTDGDVCKAVIERFPFQPEVTVPAWRRLVQLMPDDAAVQVSAGSAFYTTGLDDEAAACVEAALAVNEKFVPAWELKAALTQSPAERIRIFQRIVDIEPNNRTAFDNLIMLRPPTD